MAGHPLPTGDYRKRAMVTLDLETGSGNSVRVGPWEADISITGALRKVFKEPVVIEDRDTYAGAVAGKDVYPDISLTIRHKGKLGGGTAKTIADCLCYAGAFSGDSYTDPGGELPSHKATITITAPDGVDVFTAPNSAWTGDYSSGETNTMALKATCYRPQHGGDPDDPANQPIIRS
jgi:hypothetical protein